jgi:peptide/nickel transport system permease protein
MLKFLVYRIATIVPVLFGVSIVVFLLMKLIPGDPAEAILGPAATTEKIEMVRKSLGLDRPFYVQYFRWLWKILQGDFGMSIAVIVPVAQLVWPKFWNTVLLTGGSLVICIVVGLGVGIVSGTRQYSWFDRVSMSLTLIVANTPAFWLGLILMVVMALHLGWFPASRPPGCIRCGPRRRPSAISSITWCCPRSRPPRCPPRSSRGSSARPFST